MTDWCIWSKLWGFLMMNVLELDMADGGWSTEDWPRVSVPPKVFQVSYRLRSRGGFSVCYQLARMHTQSSSQVVVTHEEIMHWRGGVKVTMQTERTRLWYEPQKVPHSSSRNVSRIVSITYKPFYNNNGLIPNLHTSVRPNSIFPGPSCSHLCSCRLHLPFKCLNLDTSAAPAVAIYF